MLPAENRKLTDFDIHLWNESKHYRAYQKLGAHLCVEQDVAGVHFAVWAPNAVEVCVIGDFNDWSREAHRMAPSGADGYLAPFHTGSGPRRPLQVFPKGAPRRL